MALWAQFRSWQAVPDCGHGSFAPSLPARPVDGHAPVQRENEQVAESLELVELIWRVFPLVAGLSFRVFEPSFLTAFCYETVE